MMPLAVLQRSLADESAERGLVIDLAEGDLAEGRSHRQTFRRRDQLLGIGRICLAEDRRRRLDGLVADDRAEPRVVLVLGLIGLEECIVFRRLDRVPGIAGNDPAFRRLLLERIEIFGLTGKEAHDRTALEQATSVAFAYELDEVRTEGDVEDRLGICGKCLHHRAGGDLALRRPLLIHPLNVGPLRRHQLLEYGDGRLTVLIVRRNRGPTLGRQLRRRLGEHCRLHVIGGSQTERIAISLRPGDRIRQRLGRQEEHLLLVGKVAHGQADVRQERARQHGDFLARHQFVRGGQCLGRLAAVVLRDHDQLLAVYAAGRVDFLQRELPALAVGLGEGRQQRVAVDLADLDFALRHGVSGQAGNHDRKPRAQQISPSHTFASTVCRMTSVNRLRP